jgi:hypothetical protein
MSFAADELTFTQIKRRLTAHPIISAEVPVEHFVSLLLPTKRWGEASYACFASPAAARRPDQPARLHPPDRWWAVAAHGGGLRVYSLWAAVPYAEHVAWEPATLPMPDRSIAELREEVALIGELLDRVVLDFFRGEPGVASTRQALAETLAAHIPRVVVPWYRSLTPDFFEWLTHVRQQS